MSLTACWSRQGALWPGREAAARSDPPPASRHRPVPGSFAGKQTWPTRKISRTLRTTWATTCRCCLVTSGTGAWPWVESEVRGRPFREDKDSNRGAAASRGASHEPRPLQLSVLHSPASVSCAVGVVGARDFRLLEQGPNPLHLFPWQASTEML